MPKAEPLVCNSFVGQNALEGFRARFCNMRERIAATEYLRFREGNRLHSPYKALGRNLPESHLINLTDKHDWLAHTHLPCGQPNATPKVARMTSIS